MTAAERVIQVASRYVGVHEVPDGSNRGPQIDGWQRFWGMGPGSAVGPQPWCGMFASAVLREAGVTDVSHPATSVICARGREKGWVLDHAVPGALIVWCGTHVGILVSQVSPGVWRTIEGNTSNSVAWRTRELAGATIVAAPEVVGSPAPAPEREYWLEDTRAEPVLRGPWRTKSARDRAIARLRPALRARARPVKHPKGYAFLLGPRRLYGPWMDKGARAVAQATLEARVGHAMRPFSRPHTAPAAQGEALGQTT